SSVTPRWPRIAGENYSASRHRRNTERRLRSGESCNAGAHDSVARTSPAALDPPAAARRSRVAKAGRARVRSATRDVPGRARHHTSDAMRDIHGTNEKKM